MHFFPSLHISSFNHYNNIYCIQVWMSSMSLLSKHCIQGREDFWLVLCLQPVTYSIHTVILALSVAVCCIKGLRIKGNSFNLIKAKPWMWCIHWVPTYGHNPLRQSSPLLSWCNWNWCTLWVVPFQASCGKKSHKTVMGGK